MNKLVLLRVIAGVCFFGGLAGYSQKADISIKVDAANKEIVTYVTLSEIPPDVDIIWQQKIPKEAHFAAYPQNSQNAESKVIMMSFSKHLLTQTMSFSFACKMDYIEKEILWGESSIIYTDKNSEEQVVAFPAKLFVIIDYDKIVASKQGSDNSENNSKSTASNMIIVTPNKAVEVKTNTAVEVNKNMDKQVESIVQQLPEAVSDISAKVEREVERPIENKVAENKPTENKVIEGNATSLISTKPAQNADSSPKSGYFYIQVSSVKVKKPILEVRDYLHVLQEDNLVMAQKGQYYVYMVGPFSTREEAGEKLEHYQKQIRDAFVLKY